jgi:ketopantoate hydroxymethyltransferase
VYVNLNKEISSALKRYADDVSKKKFPNKKHSSSYKSNIIDKLK